jgi:hypothetical protein
MSWPPFRFAWISGFVTRMRTSISSPGLHVPLSVSTTRTCHRVWAARREVHGHAFGARAGGAEVDGIAAIARSARTRARRGGQAPAQRDSDEEAPQGFHRQHIPPSEREIDRLVRKERWGAHNDKVKPTSLTCREDREHGPPGGCPTLVSLLTTQQ